MRFKTAVPSTLALGLALLGATGCTATLATPASYAAQSTSRLAIAIGANVAGKWITSWASGEAVLVLYQNGYNVSGSYSGASSGTVEGTLDGNVLRGRWISSDGIGRGGMEFVFSPDGATFNGTWGTSDSSLSNGGAWNGQAELPSAVKLAPPAAPADAAAKPAAPTPDVKPPP